MLCSANEVEKKGSKHFRDCCEVMYNVDWKLLDLSTWKLLVSLLVSVCMYVGGQGGKRNGVKNSSELTFIKRECR